MKVFDLLQKINEHKLYDLPLKIKYMGKIYTKEGASFTYYENGKSKGNTLCINTIDINDDCIEVIDDRLYDDDDEEEISELCDKLRDLCEDLEEITDKIEMLDL